MSAERDKCHFTYDEKTKYRHNICPFCGIVGMERNGYSEYYAFDCGTTIYAGYMQSCDKNTITQTPACKRIAELQEQLEKARRGATRATRESASTS